MTMRMLGIQASLVTALVLTLPTQSGAQPTFTRTSALGDFGCQFHSNNFFGNTTDNDNQSIGAEYYDFMAQAAELESQLIQLDINSGIWTEERANLLMEMANTNFEIGNKEDAKEQFEEALFNIRINRGLYSDVQLPIIFDLMAWYMVDDDQFIDELGDRASFLLEKSYTDEEQIPQLVAWYLELLQLRREAHHSLNTNNSAHYEKAQALGERISKLLEAAFNSDNPAIKARIRGEVEYFSGYDDFGVPVETQNAALEQISSDTGAILETVERILSPSDPIVETEYEEAKQLLDELYANYNSLGFVDRTALWDFYASYFIAIDDFSSAIGAYGNMLNIEVLRPDYQLRALRSLGQLYEQQEFWSSAILAYDCWLQLSEKKDARVFLGLGNAHHRMDSFEPGIQNLLEYLEIAEAEEMAIDTDVYLALRDMYLRTGDVEAAQGVERDIDRVRR